MAQESLKQGSPRWEQLRERARNDLYWLTTKVLGLEDKVPIVEHAHYALCKFVTRQTGIPEIDRSRVQLIQVGRGWGKSAIVTNGLVTQKLLRNRDYAVGLANERQENANAFLAAVKANFESNEFLQFLFPEHIPDFRETTWKADRIVINRTKPNPVSPSVLASGVGATVTGVHMNEWIVDDLISKEAAENARAGSFTEIDKANRWIIQLQPLLQNPNDDPLTFIGTPWWLGDCYDYIEEAFGDGAPATEYEWIIDLPSGGQHRLRLTQRGQLAIFRLPAINDAGRAVFPERFSLKVLNDIRRRDPVFFAAQYLLNPSAGEAAAFKPEWLKDFDWEMDAKQLRYRDFDGSLHFVNVRDLTCITSCDPAISDKQGSARSGIVTVGTDGRHLFLLSAWAGRVGATELAERMLDEMVRWKSAYLVFESVAYQEALADVLALCARQRRITGRLPIYEHRTGGLQRKEVRILGLEPFFNKGLFYVHTPSQQDFLDEYRGFPHTKLRDMLDALSFQKELWERLATQHRALDDDLALSGPLATKRKLSQRAHAAKVRARYGRRRYRSGGDGEF